MNKKYALSFLFLTKLQFSYVMEFNMQKSCCSTVLIWKLDIACLDCAFSPERNFFVISQNFSYDFILT